MIDIKQLQEELEKRMVANLGMSLDHEEKGYSLEQLYEFAGKEDRVITISFRDGSESEKYFGQTITCKLLYRERERINLLQSINAGGCNYGKVRAEYLLYDKTKEQVDKLVSEGFDSKDVVEILVAPLMQPDNIYGAESPRQFKTIEIPLEPEPPLEELKFEFGGLCHFMQDGMLLTPAEQIDFLALKLVLGVKLTEDEKSVVFDEAGLIHNNKVSIRYLYYKSTLSELSEEKKKAQAKLEAMRAIERMNYLDRQLKRIGSSIAKLNDSKKALCEQMVRKVLSFNETRLNSIGRYPIYLTYEGYIHIGLRHIAEWRFNNFYDAKSVFQMHEKDVIPTLHHIVDGINEDFQKIKAERPDFLYRKFGKESLYLNGDYYMIHIAADGSIENFSKSEDRKKE